jgi:hypothetical protein
MAGRTIKQPIFGEPMRVHEGGDGSFAKPGELIEIRSSSALTHQDRRTFNLLMVTAWDRINEAAEHIIKKTVLRGTHNGTDYLSETLRRLMTTIVEINVIRDGKPAIRRVQLLGATDEHRDDTGNLYYTFPPRLIEIIKDSDHWGRLQAQVMMAMSSKYSLSLYELIQKRAGYTSRFSEEFSVQEMRELLGVPPGKLERYPDLRRFCLEPAVVEVSALSSCHVKIEPIKQGRLVTALKLCWFPKDELGLKAAYTELQRHKVGRRALIHGTVEETTVAHSPPLFVELDNLGQD